MKKGIETYLWKEGKNKTISEVQNYWTENINTTQFWRGDADAVGTPEFFNVVGKYIQKNYSHRYRLIKSESEKYRGGKLLEIGCGAGWELISWAKEGMQVTGIDLSKSALQLAKKNFEYNELSADLRYGNGEELEFEDSSFNIISSFGVLHHTKDLQKAISEIYRVLKPSGEAVMTFYHKNSWKLKLTKLAKVNFEFGHEDAPITRLYSKKSIGILFNKFKTLNITVDYIDATPTLRNGMSSKIYNYAFVPSYNLIPEFIRRNFGHSLSIVAVK